MSRAPETKTFLATLTAYGRLSPEILALLESRIGGGGDWTNLVAILQGTASELLGGPDGASEETEVRQGAAALMLEAGRIWEQELERPEKAIALYQQAFRSFPKGTEALAEARRIYHKLEKSDMVAQLLAMELERTTEESARKGLLSEMLALMEGPLDDQVGAERCRRELEALIDNRAPRHGAAESDEIKPREERVQDEKRLPQTEKKDDLTAADAVGGEQQPKSTSRPAPAGVRSSAGVSPRSASVAGGAGRTLTPALVAEVEEIRRRASEDAEAGDGAVSSQLQREADLLEKGDWRGLLIHYGQIFGQGEAAAIHGRLAQVAEMAEVGSRALEGWRQVLLASPGNPEAREAIKRIGAQEEKWQLVLDVLKSEAEEIPDSDVDAKVSKYLEMISIYRDRLNQDVMVANLYGQILKLDPGNIDALDKLAAQYEKSRRWPDLVGVLQNKAELAATPAEKLEIMRQIAAVYVGKFSNHAEGIKAYERILELEPGDREAIEYLKEMYQKRRDWEKFVSLSQEEARLIDDPQERAAVLTETAKMATERMQRSPLVGDLWNAVLDLDPDNLDALAALQAFHERQKNWNELAEILERQARLTSGPERVGALEKLGVLLGDRLRDGERAATVWQEVLQEDPDHLRARDALKKSLIDARRWDELEMLFLEAGNEKELVRILESQVGIVPDVAVKVDLLFRTARLWRDRIGQEDRAVRALERVLQYDESNYDAAVALIPYFEEKKNWRRLAACLEVQVARTDDPVTRLEALRALMEVAAERLGDGARAFECAGRAFQEAPGEERSMDDLERLAEAVSGWDQVARLYEEGLPGLTDGVARIRVQAALGRVLSVRLGRYQEALKAFDAVLQQEPANLEALGALEDLYKRTGEWEQYLQVAERLAGLIGDGKEILRLQKEIAVVREEQLGDAEGAVEALRQAMELAPDSLEIARNLHRILLSEARHLELAEVLRTEIALLGEQGGPAAAGELQEMRLELARVLMDDLDSPEEAEGLLVRVLGEDPGNGRAVAGLEELAHDPTMLPRIADVLEPIYEESMQWGKLVELLESRIGNTAEVASRVALLNRVAELYATRLGDAQQAFRAYAASFREDPEVDETRASLERLASEAELAEELVGLYGDVVDEVVRPDLASSILVTVARIQGEQLGNLDEAIGAYQRVLEIDPDAEQALVALESLFTRGEMWDELVALLGRLASRAETPQERVGHLYRMAQIQDEMLGNSRDAIGTWREILAVDDSDLRALEALETLYSAEEMWDELGDNLLHQLRIVEPKGERAEGLTLKLAALKESSSASAAEAMALYEQVLTSNPSSQAAREAMERFLDDLELANHAASVLEPLYEEAGEWDKLVAVVELRARMESDNGVKAALLVKLASVAQVRLHDGEAAFRALGQAYVLNPVDGKVGRELFQLGEMLGQWAALTEHMNGAAGVLARKDPALALPVLVQLASIQEQELGDPQEAINTCRWVVSLDPGNQEATDRLERLLSRLEQWGDLVELLQERARLESDEQRRVGYLLRSASIDDELLERPERAVEGYRSVLQVDGDNRKALDGLARLYAALGDNTGYLEVLGGLLRVEEDPDQLAAFHMARAQVMESGLSDWTGAAEEYQEARRLRPGDDEVLVPLVGVLSRTGQWTELLEVLEERAQIVPLAQERVGIDFERARIHKDELGNPERALAIYQEIIRLQPEHEGTLSALEGMVREGDGHSRTAASLLTEHYRTLGEWARLAGVYDGLLPHLGEQAERVALRKDYAALLENKLEDAEGAFRVLAGGVTEDKSTDSAILDTLERLADPTGRRERLASLLETALGNLGWGDELDPALVLRLASCLYPQLGRAEEALDLYRRLLELHPEVDQAWNALAALLESEARWEELAALLEERRTALAGGEDREQVARITMQLAAMMDSVLANPGRSVALYGEALQMGDPAVKGEAVAALEGIFDREKGERAAIARILSPVLRESGQWEKLVSTMAQVVDLEDEPVSRSLIFKDMASIQAGQLGDLDAALLAFGQALELNPADGELVGECERLTGVTGDWSNLVELFSRVAVRHVEQPTLQVDLLLRSGVIVSEHLHDVDGAVDKFQGALEIDPVNLSALEYLTNLHRDNGRWAELVEVLERLSSVVDRTEERAALLHERGTVLLQHVGDRAGAVEAHRQVLEQDPHHEGSMSALEAIHEQAEQWAELFQVLGSRVGVARETGGDVASIAEMLGRMAALAHRRLGDPVEATSLWNEVLDLRGDDDQALAALEDLHREQEQYSDLAEVLERRVKLAEEPAAKGELLARLGRVQTGMLEDLDGAVRSWRKLLELNPDDFEALWALSELHEKTGEFEQVAATLESIIDRGIVEEEGRRAQIHARLGQLYGEVLQLPEKALAQWQRVLDFDSENLQALVALQGLYREGGRWEEFLASLDRRLELTEPEGVRLELLLEAARVSREQLENSTLSAEYHEQVLSIDGANREALDALKQYYDANNMNEQLLDVVLRKLEKEEHSPDKLELLDLAANICEVRLDAPENAFYCLARAFQESRAQELIPELERLAGLSHRWEELLDLYENAIQESSDGREEARLIMRVGAVYAEELEAVDEAIEAYRRALELEKDNEEIVSALDRLYTRKEAWVDLVDHIQMMVEFSPEPATKSHLYTRLGRVYAEKLDDLHRAVSAYQEALRFVPGDGDALDALEQAYTRGEMWEELVELLESRVADAGRGEESVLFAVRIGRIWEESLGNPPRAVEAYRAVLELEPADLFAQEALERIHIEQEDWGDLVALYEDIVSQAAYPHERRTVLEKLATVREERLLQPHKAVEVFERILEDSPADRAILEQLCSIHREQGEWRQLSEALVRYAQVTADEDDKEATVPLLLELGRVQADKLSSLEAAAEPYGRLLTMAEGDTLQQVVEEFIDLQLRRGQWGEALELLDTLADLVTDPEERVGVHFRIGEVHRRHGEDTSKAEEHYYAALELDQQHTPSIEALKTVYEQREDYVNTIQMLRRLEETSDDLVQKGRYLLEIGNIYEKWLDDPVGAAECYEKCIELDPENIEAARPLSKMYLEEGRWERAEPLLDTLLAKLGKSRDPQLAYELHYNVAWVAEKLNKEEKALRHYRHAFELDQTQLPAMEGLGRILYLRQDWDRAFKVFQTLLVHQRDRLSPQVAVQIFHKLGSIKRNTGEVAKAQSLFEKGLDLDPTHRATVEALVEIFREQGEWEKVVEFKERLAEVAEDRLDKFALLVEVAEVLREEIGNEEKAVDVYQEALGLDPTSRAAMHSLLNLYNSLERWKEATTTLMKLAEQETDPVKKAKFYYTGGVMMRDRLSDADGAIDTFNLSLDEDPTQLKAFEAVDKQLTANRDWEALERNYRRMIKRAGEVDLDRAVLSVLWKGLGEIYRTRLKKQEDAALAFQKASALDPDDENIHGIIAQLHEQNDQLDKAIQEHQEILRIAPLRIESYKALYRLYWVTRRYDQSWCLAAALSVLREAAPEVEQFYLENRPSAMARAVRPLEQDVWSKALYHQDLNLQISNIFALLAPFNPFARSLKEGWGLKGKDQLDLTKPLLFNTLFSYAVKMVQVPPQVVPEVYVKKDKHAGLRSGNTPYKWSLVVGPDMLQGKPDRELTFSLGRNLSLFRPENYLAGVLPVPNLKLLFFAAWQLSMPETPVPVTMDPQAFAAVVKALQKEIPQPVLVELRKRMGELINSRQAVDLASWVEAVEYTVNRAGMVLAGDLETAARGVRDEAANLSKLSPKDKMEDLLRFFVSEAHFRARESMGLARSFE